MKAKECVQCGQEKPPKELCRKYAVCKECWLAFAHRPLEEKRRDHPKWVPLRALLRTKRRKHSSASRRAWRAVRNAIRAGELQRRPCEACGDTPSQAHHPSYRKPDRLRVQWLCKECHDRAHGRPPPKVAALAAG